MQAQPEGSTSTCLPMQPKTAQMLPNPSRLLSKDLSLEGVIGGNVYGSLAQRIPPRGDLPVKELPGPEQGGQTSARRMWVAHLASRPLRGLVPGEYAAPVLALGSWAALCCSCCLFSTRGAASRMLHTVSGGGCLHGRSRGVWWLPAWRKPGCQKSYRVVSTPECLTRAHSPSRHPNKLLEY